MSTEIRVLEGTLCDHCKNPEAPLTEANSVHLVPRYQRDHKGMEITAANVHRECAEPWAKANDGTIASDEPLPPRPFL